MNINDLPDGACTLLVASCTADNQYQMSDLKLINSKQGNRLRYDTIYIKGQHVSLSQAYWVEIEDSLLVFEKVDDYMELAEFLKGLYNEYLQMLTEQTRQVKIQLPFVQKGDLESVRERHRQEMKEIRRLHADEFQYLAKQLTV
jgi:hypothetical protein